MREHLVIMDFSEEREGKFRALERRFVYKASWYAPAKSLQDIAILKRFQ